MTMRLTITNYGPSPYRANIYQAGVQVAALAPSEVVDLYCWKSMPLEIREATDSSPETPSPREVVESWPHGYAVRPITVGESTRWFVTLFNRRGGEAWSGPEALQGCESQSIAIVAAAEWIANPQRSDILTAPSPLTHREVVDKWVEGAPDAFITIVDEGAKVILGDLDFRTEPMSWDVAAEWVIRQTDGRKAAPEPSSPAPQPEGAEAVLDPRPLHPYLEAVIGAGLAPTSESHLIELYPTVRMILAIDSFTHLTNLIRRVGRTEALSPALLVAWCWMARDTTPDQWVESSPVSQVFELVAAELQCRGRLGNRAIAMLVGAVGKRATP